MANPAEYKQIAELLNDVSAKFNFHVSPSDPAGKPCPLGREYRMQLIVITNDTSDIYKKSIVEVLKKSKAVKDIQFNELSPNSSKYSSVSFRFGDVKVDAVISKGANNGEKFEKQTVTDLQHMFKSSGVGTPYKDLIAGMIKANPAFAKNEIKSVKQRKGSTRKEGVPIEQLGAIIGDVVLTDSTGKEWFISLKDIDGDTFSSYSGAATLFDSAGTLQPNSGGATFLKAFGVNLNHVQSGFDQRNGIVANRPKIPLSTPNNAGLTSIFERAWGMNYFYVRKQSGGWKVFWLDKKVLEQLSRNIKIDNIKYPRPESKQISIYCSNAYASYLVELRNSKRGEYPNDTKFKIKQIRLH